jgi:methylated-DNA-[protein]-cysteine S-methyltransferase
MLTLAHAAGTQTLDFVTLSAEVVPSPFGPLRLWTSELGLCAVTIDAVDDDRLQHRFARATLREAEGPSEAARQIEAWFAGRRADFDLAVDLRNLPEFQQRVLEALLTVPAGEVCTYGDLAARVGRPGGARAVGNALGRNPIPIVVPCHRVLAAGGKIGGYTGGLHRKCLLLRLERPAGVTIPTL